jgi:hypothetical protein
MSPSYRQSQSVDSGSTCSQSSSAPSERIERSSAWRDASAGETDGMWCSQTVCLLKSSKADLMPSATAILVLEAFLGAEAERCQSRVLRHHVPVAISLAANHEVMAPIVAPTEGDLHDGVQIGKSRVSAHKQPSPDGPFDVVEQHVDLIDLRRLRGQQAIISAHDRTRAGVPEVSCSRERLVPRRQPPVFSGLLHDKRRQEALSWRSRREARDPTREITATCRLGYYNGVVDLYWWRTMYARVSSIMWSLMFRNEKPYGRSTSIRKSGPTRRMQRSWRTRPLRSGR